MAIMNPKRALITLIAVLVPVPVYSDGAATKADPDRYILRGGEKRTVRLVEGTAEFICEASQQSAAINCSGFCSCVVPIPFGSYYSGETLYIKGSDEFDGYEKLRTECRKLCVGKGSKNGTLYRRRGEDELADPQNACD